MLKPHGLLNEWKYLFFADPLCYESYIQALNEISRPEYLDSLFNAIDEELELKLAILHSDFPQYVFDKKEILYANQKVIEKFLNQQEGIQVNLQKVNPEKKTIELMVSSKMMVPTQVLYMSFQDSIKFDLEEKPILQGINIDSSSVQLSVKLPSDFVWYDSLKTELKLAYRLVGNKQAIMQVVLPWDDKKGDSNYADILRIPANLGEFPFVKVNHTSRSILIEAGIHNIRKNMIIPPEYKFQIAAGAELILENGAMILSHSPVFFMGEADNPIRIHQGSTPGQGIAVINAGEESSLKHTIFDGLGNPTQGNWKLTGAVTFYQSPVEIRYCQFLNNLSEDGLNIFGTDYLITNSRFANTLSDAFDGDFTQGVISHTEFENCGNDAIDISGSTLSIKNIKVNKIGDKGLSAGEKSQMFADQVEVSQAEIAITSKDSSYLIINNLTVINSRIAFAAYQKKPEYGPAVIQADMVTMENIELKYLIEEKSLLTEGEEVIPSSRKNVKEILYGVEYGKSSKPKK